MSVDQKYFIHIDLDEPWIYENIESDKIFLNSDLYTQALDTAIEIVELYDLKCVLFVVGKSLNSIRGAQLFNYSQKGHLIGNHSYNHDENYIDLSITDRIIDFQKNHNTLISYNLSPIYFRAPGYVFDAKLHPTLSELGYRFDCSRMPIFFTTILNWHFKFLSKPRKKFLSCFNFDHLQKVFLKSKFKNIQEINLVKSKIFGVPFYSTRLWKQVHFKKNKGGLQHTQVKITNPPLFHLVDFLDLQISNSNIPALRLSLSERLEYIHIIFSKIKLESK